MIVDDGSANDTLQTNEGAAVSRNVALDTAKEEMIAFCDTDDYSEKDLIRQHYDVLVQNPAGLLLKA